MTWLLGRAACTGEDHARGQVTVESVASGRFFLVKRDKPSQDGDPPVQSGALSVHT